MRRGSRMEIGYARVSTSEQDTATQLQLLREAGCQKVFQEEASGGRWERPQLQALLDFLREGDVVVVWKLDRLSRSLKDLLLIIERIDQAKAGFKSLTEQIDTTNPAGRMMMQMLGAFAEFEREMIRARTKAGLEAARKEGRKGGRKAKLNAKQRQAALEMLQGNKTQGQVAQIFNVSRATISRLVATHRHGTSPS